MTLDEFYKRLLVQKNSQSSNLINNTVDTSEMSNTIKNIQNNKVSDTKNNIINSYGSNTKKVLKAPISKTLNKSANIDISNFSKQDGNIFEDIGNNVKNLGIGIKQGGLNFTNYMAKVGDYVSDKVFNREEKTIESLNEDLKQYGIDGSKLTIQEKINKLIEIDPLSMDKYSDLLSSKMRYTGDGITSKIGNALSVMQGNNSSGILAPYQEMIDGKTITEDENGKNQIDSWFGKNNEKNIDNRIVELQEEANKNTENVSNPILKYTAGLAPSIGNNATSMAISAVNPLASTLYFTGSAANSYALDGKELGLSDDASLVYGTILGVIDGQLEKIGLENFKKGTKGMLKGNVREAIKKYAIDMADNYIQEALMEPAQETVNQLFVGKSNWNGMLGRMNEAGMSGAVSSAILGGTTGTVTKGINTVNNIKVNNQVKTEIINKIDSTNLLENNVKDTLKKAVSRLDGKSLATLSQNLNILDEVKQGIDKTNIDDFLEKRLSNKNNQTPQNISANPQKEVSKQAFLNSAKANNINVNNNTEVLDSMFEMAYQRGVNISIDGKAFNSNNQNALWRVNQETGQREVVINPNNPQKALQSITIHELTHDMENTEAYDELSKVVLDYAKKQDNYDNAFKDLSDMYAEEYKQYKGEEFTNKINQEMVADILGEKLGNQEFVNSIVISNRGVAQSIYGWIVDKLNKVNKLTGYKFEKLYWADVKNKFEKAFNTDFNNLTNEVKYAKKGDIIDNENKVWYNKNGINLDYKEKYFIDGYINTNFSQMEVGTEFAKEVGDYLYVGQKIADGEFEYYAKIQIEGNENKIDNIRRSINRNGINEEGRTIDRIIQEIRNVGRTNNSDTSSSTDGGTREQVDRLYSRQSKNNNIESNTTQSIGNQSRIENNQELTPTSSFFVAKTDLTDENIKKYILPEIEERYKNESKEKITETLEELKSQKSKIDIETDEGWDKNFEINQKIKAIENGYDNIYEFLVNHDLNELRTEEIIDKIEKKKALEEKQIKLQREIEEATPFKRAQYELIQKTNPMFDEEHVGIRSPKDIKTFEECIRDADEDSVFVWGDYTKEDAIRDLKRNKVRVYSSYAIKNGVFVSTSYRQALDYAGNDPTKVHSKEVNPSKIAWINGDEGQYASVSIAPTSKGNIKYSKFDSGEYENFLQDNFSNNGTKTYMEDIKLPSKIANLKDELRSIVDKSKDMDSEMKDSLIELINNTDDEKELQSYKESLQPKAPVKSGTIKITNYKNAKLNSKVVNNALSMIEANKQGKRTKTQWLQVAEQIGMNIKENEIDKYAYKTWSEFLPNQKDNLNRQGEKYVKFTRDEWIKAVEEGYKKANEIKINYLRNTNSNGSKYSYGDFGQNLEPAGEYMNQDTTNGEYKVPGFEYGTITFKNPLILDHKNTSSTGWKKDLSNMFNGKTGKKLSNEIIKAGYDAIITKDENGNYVEIVNLNGKKINGNGEKNFDTSIDNKKSNIIDEKVSEYIKSIKDNFNTDINIGTNVVTSGNASIVDYKNAKEVTLRNRAKQLFEKIGKKVFNNNNEKIYVSNTDISESIHKTISNIEQKQLINENLAVFSKLDEIIEKGKEISDSIDVKGRSKYSNWKYYVSNVKIDGKPYIVEFDTVLRDNNQRHFRLERVYKINKEASVTGVDKNLVNQFVPEASINNIIPSEQNYVNNTKKTMNPTEIANLKPEDASSTPDLQSKNYEKGDKESSFYKNITNNSKFLNPELRKELKNEDDIKYYKSVTNEESLTEALKRLDSDGASETSRWFNKKDKFTSSDVAEGYILLKRYQDVGDYKNATEVAKKMRDIGTTAGQTTQAFNILNRLTPEGMTVYSQKILSDTFEEFKKNKTQEWIKENEEKFNLTAEEQDFIKEKVNEASKYDEHSYERRVALAEIQKMMEDKLPTTLGKEVKSWMRIAMLCNPKTQVRNVTGNAIIVPVNAVSDFFASGIDKYLSKFTGVRTTGNANVKSLIKGAIKGAYEATNDYKKGINTKNIDGNRFEIGKGKSFTEKTIVGKSLNNIENLLNYVMDAGDRVFSEAWFENSIANQLELNNTTEITQDMIDIATQEALSRTWNDNNNYTKLVLNIRKALNGINVGGYGLGDVLIPFAKTPANLTKAIVDYSPVGLVNSLVQGVNLKNSISTGQVTAQQQHKFVQDLGKATAGTLLYIAGYALAKAGITTGDSDEDKDAKNFIQKTLGINSYSIKIGDKSFTYDWAQPIAAPLSITANIVNSKNKEKALYEAVVSNLDTAGSILLEQSFLSSINDVLSNNDGFVSGLINEILELPARAIPTFSKQIADLVDGTQRQTFVKGSPIKSAGNQMLAKIPFASRMLAPTVDTLGNEVKKYGGKNNIFNVMFNPANVNSENISEAGKEIYKIYQKTGDKTIFPRTADYSLTYDGENYNLSTQERAEYQKIMGKYVDNTVSELIKSQDYQSLDNKEKAKIINEIVSDGNEIAKLEYAKQHNLKYERTSTDLKVENEIEKGLNVANAYVYKANIRNIEGNKDLNGKTINGTTTNNKINYIMDMEISDTQKQHLVNLLTDNVDYNLSVNDLKKLNGNYLTYLQQSGKTPENGGMTAREQYIQLINSGISVTQLNKFYSEISDIEGQKDSNGDTISGSKKQAVFDYVNSLSLSVPQKQILLARQYESFAKLYYNDILNYINNLDLKESEKYKIYESVFKKLN